MYEKKQDRKKHEIGDIKLYFNYLIRLHFSKRENHGTAESAESDGVNGGSAPEGGEGSHTPPRELQHPLLQHTTIDPKEIPAVPTNKFLMRGGASKDDDKKDRGDRGRNQRYVILYIKVKGNKRCLCFGIMSLEDRLQCFTSDTFKYSLWNTYTIRIYIRELL